MKTKYGTAYIANNGYYTVKNKLLHRLIWEDFWDFTVPKGYVIHHKNGNKLDNCILNLQLMKHSEHNKLHMLDKDVSIETREKLSDLKLGTSRPSNSTGYYRVHTEKGSTYKQGFTYVYEIDSSRLDGKRTKKKIKSVDLKKLEAKVKAQGYEWRKID